MSKTTLRLSPELHKRIRILAIERETTFAALVEEAVRDLLAKTRKRGGGQ